jgi:hypothetical protein
MAEFTSTQNSAGQAAQAPSRFPKSEQLVSGELRNLADSRRPRESPLLFGELRTQCSPKPVHFPPDHGMPRRGDQSQNKAGTRLRGGTHAGRCGVGLIATRTARAIASAARMVALTGFSRSMSRLSAAQFEPPHLVQASQAIFAVENVDEIPHGRTPLFGEAIRASVHFRVLSSGR